ncbi:hypothetical protein IMZ48_17780 [Candidatus Bathyarchaeota archaeon]|nr:hypothetical protein [Candidatus Bathyarchaeota archaeon]
MTRNFFSGDTKNKAGSWEAATSNIVAASSSIAKDALNSASDDRAELAFNAIYDPLIESWKSQTDTLVKTLFSGEATNIKRLTEIVKDGHLIDGKSEVDGWSPGNHTDNWVREKNIERAFYAAAIPAVWTADSSYPVVVDFGPSCDIDARKYFWSQPQFYNKGWRCHGGHSYILATVRGGPQKACETPVMGQQCPPAVQWTLDIPTSIGVIQEPDNRWGGVTVDDLIVG